MIWVKTSEDERLPGWLKKELRETCEVCGTPILNGYNERGECTRRKCTNDNCPKALGVRVGALCTALNYSGIKDANGYSLVQQYQLKSHFDVVPILFKDKPKVRLPQLFRLAFIYGVDSEFDSICHGYQTPEEVFNGYNGKYKEVIEEKREDILHAAKYFDIVLPTQVKQEYKPVLFGTVVITGEVNGVSHRDTFIPAINKKFKGLTALGYSKSKRKTGLYCCISEDKAASTGKVAEAVAAGAPVLTSNEFIIKVIQDLVDLGYSNEVQAILEEGRAT